MKALRVIQNIVLGSLALFALLFVLVSTVAGPDTAFRIFYYNDTDIDDYKTFPSRRLRASPNPFHFTDTTNLTLAPSAYGGVPLDSFLERQRTVAFLVIKDDTIVYERYFGNYAQSTPVQAFSVSKSLLSVLVGRAVNDGYITVDQPVAQFVPELTARGFDRVTIEDLLQMASGSNYRQTGLAEVNPFGLHLRFEYSPRLAREITTVLRVSDEPGAEFVYKSGDTALLSLVLSRALRDKTITEYMQETIWTPLGMEFDGFYTIDHVGADALEKTWCCLAATARDVAKFGRLMLNNGVWNGAQIISSEWVERSTSRDPTEARVMNLSEGLSGYQYQWWLASEGRAYLAMGKLGQYLYVNPKECLIIVRLGRRGADPISWLKVFETLAQDSRLPLAAQQLDGADPASCSESGLR